MNICLSELNTIFHKYPNSIIEKIYYYYYTILDYKIQKNIINYKINNDIIKDYSINSYVNYVPIKYIF